MITEFERNTIAEIKGRVGRGEHVENWEKQTILDMMRREGGILSVKAADTASAAGFNVEGIRLSAKFGGPEIPNLLYGK